MWNYMIIVRQSEKQTENNNVQRCVWKETRPIVMNYFNDL